MPCKSRWSGHVDCISRTQPQDDVLDNAFASVLLHLNADDKEGITAQTYTNQASVTVFTDVSMYAECVPWRVEIDYRCLSFHVWKEAS